MIKRVRKNGYLELMDSSAKEGGELLADVDWQRTRAYAVGFGSIYFNQQGLDNAGIGADALKKEIATKLEAWKDSKNGEPIIKKVYTKEEIFWGEHAAEAPDLFIGFNGGYRASWQTATGAVPAVEIEDNTKKWSGDHLIDPSLVPGILFSNKTLAAHASMYDLAPTILHAAGYPDDKLKTLNFDGKSLL